MVLVFLWIHHVKMDEFKLSRLCLGFEDMKVPELRFPRITLL